MTLLPKPSTRSLRWSVPSHPELRISITERPGINIYTGIERSDGEGQWTLVPDSSVGHGDLFGAAESRVARLLEGEWRKFVPDADPPPPQLTPEEILRKPYARTFLLNDNGVFTAFILEFPGCIAEAGTIADAYMHLDEAATSWLLAMQASGNPIPDPFEGSEDRSVLQVGKLWMAVEKWRLDFPLGSADELSRAVMKIVAPRT